MFSKAILDEDKFLDLPAECQALYFPQAMKADDEGFGAGPNNMMKMLNLKKDSLTELEKSGYIFLFESGVYLVRHWHIHNRIRKDRANETMYQQEKSRVEIDGTGVYTLSAGGTKKALPDTCPAGGGQMPAQEREEEIRLGKDRLGKEREEKGGSLQEDKIQKLLDKKTISFPYAVTPSAFKKYTDKMEYECIEYAFLEAKAAGKHSLGYVRAVLERLLREGITTKDKLTRTHKLRNGPVHSDEEDFVERYAFEKDELLGRMEQL